MLFFRQTWTLVVKNLLIVLFRHPFSTPLRCFLLPVAFTIFLAYTRHLLIPQNKYGIGDQLPVRSLADALHAAGADKTRIAFVNNGFTGGDIEQVIRRVADQATAEGKTVEILSHEEDLLTACRSTLRGHTNCYGAAVFYASPSEGLGGIWNYSLRADGAFGFKIDVSKSTNDAEIYPLPLQHDIDFAIASLNQSVDQSSLPRTVREYPFTDETQKEYDDDNRRTLMNAIINFFGVAFFIGIIGVTYQLVGLIASEREIGMTQIIDASMPNKRTWQPQAARFLGAHIAFDIMFLPGWICIGLTMAFGIFTKTSAAVSLFFNILAGISLTSFSIFGAVFFHKAQLSGITTTIVSLLLGILAQFLRAGTGAIAILGLLFPPMNYVFLITFMARWERKLLPTNLLKAAPENIHNLPGIVFIIFFCVQILIFPILGSFTEKMMYGTASKGRIVRSSVEGVDVAVELSGFTKKYIPSWWFRYIARRFGKKRETVVAVDKLDLAINKGQIMVLLGANGSGKSTTLEAIAGLSTVTHGSILVNGAEGIGICPQRNVLWDHLTVVEHVRIFNRLKSNGPTSSESEMRELISSCDLDRKLTAQSRHLSGGQKRKLQLSIMFTGGSRVCCVDECSSGVDALARQKLWNILLQERGARTIIFTTHFLDEADLLSDSIAILSKGCLKAHGSSVELKHRLGEGYRIHISKAHQHSAQNLAVENIPKRVLHDQTIYTLPNSSQAVEFIRMLDVKGIYNYEITSPTIEEIFFNVAEESNVIEASPSSTRGRQLQDVPSIESQKIEVSANQQEKALLQDNGGAKAHLQLQNGRSIDFVRQTFTLFGKRWTILQKNWKPYIAALVIPVVAAGLVTLFLKNFKTPGCSPSSQLIDADLSSFDYAVDIKNVPIGPSNKISNFALTQLGTTLFPLNGQTGGKNDVPSPIEQLRSAIHLIDGNFDDFNNYVKSNFRNILPGGLFLGDDQTPPTFAYHGNGDLQEAVFVQNALDTLVTNVSISTTYNGFVIPFSGSSGNMLQLITYFGLAMSVYPAFLSLYPTLERLRSIRQLQYSNGVKSVSLWSAYITFDFIVVLGVSVISTVIFRAATNGWYHLEYLFVVLFCYGLASTLLSYVISLFSRSQLAAFAFTAGGQAVMFLLYLIAYLTTLTYAPSIKTDRYVSIVHFTIALISPIANLIRAMFVSVNIFSIDCRDHVLASYPGDITLYGGPILYLVVQSVIFFTILLLFDSGPILIRFRRKPFKSLDSEEAESHADEIAAEVRRVHASPDDGLRVLHLSKTYGSNIALQDVTFGVRRGEVFALLGPNGAGKSTAISLIRGDIQPSDNRGQVFVENISVGKRRLAARNFLGVCPQVDACDQMTVVDHLRFYARIRGVADTEDNTNQVIHAVGLDAFASCLAANLSGGNKRKLCLAIALMGNPSVLLLDEPSSGMDVCAKRLMWRTLATVAPGRSIVLTTHSMEEADALADRAGIIGGKMLALGTSEQLRRQHGDLYYVHLITKTAPHTSPEEMERIRVWINKHLVGAIFEERTFHGQLRFSIPANRSAPPPRADAQLAGHSFLATDAIHPAPPSTHARITNPRFRSSIGSLFTTLESHKNELGFEYFSIGPTTLDQVFLTIVGKHAVEEEGYAVRTRGRRGRWIGRSALQ